MNALVDPEYCSSGCESGWTLYLQEKPFISHNRGSEGFCEEKRGREMEESDDEDLSMVSDASSWPPHFHDDEHNNNNCFHEQENDCFCSAPKEVKQGKTSDGKKRQRVKEIQQNEPSFLHDTASSHVFDFSMNNIDVTNQQISTESMLDCSQGFSATYFERRSPFQGHFDFFQPSLSENQLQENKWYGGKGIGMR